MCEGHERHLQSVAGSRQTGSPMRARLRRCDVTNYGIGTGVVPHVGEPSSSCWEVAVAE
jgi:hypothetical protein